MDHPSCVIANLATKHHLFTLRFFLFYTAYVLLLLRFQGRFHWVRLSSLKVWDLASWELARRAQMVGKSSGLVAMRRCAVGAKALFLHQCHRAFLAGWRAYIRKAAKRTTERTERSRSHGVLKRDLSQNKRALTLPEDGT